MSVSCDDIEQSSEISLGLSECKFVAELDQGIGKPGHPSCERETEVEHEDLRVEWSVSVAT